MSGQWEVVGKKKDKVTKIINQKTAKESNKKKVENLNVKVEDVLAKSQVKNLYNDKNKENKPLDKKSQEVSGKKTQKKQEKPQEQPKPKSPKSIESALNQLNVEEFKDIFENSRSHFPNAPIVWLKELAQYLNQKISLELQDPIFSTKPKSFPLSVVPPGIKSVMDRATKEADKSNMQLFFDITLTSMATDMSKNLPALGHKLFLQYMALSEPNLVSENLVKHTVLRNSYLNRPNIGLSILWAVGQAGADFQIGFKVFQELMLPLVEMKNYSRFIFKYLLDLISNAKEVPLTKEQHLLVLETVYLNKKNYPNDLKQDLIAVIPKLKDLLFVNSNKDTVASFTDFYFKKLTINSSSSYFEHICDVLVDCFNRDSSSMENWCKIYSKNVTSSAILLRYMDNNWETVGKKINHKAFLHALEEIAVINDELMLKKRKEEGLIDVVNIGKKLAEKMANKKKSGSSFKFFFLTSLLIATAIIYYDVKQQGTWESSKTNKALKDLRVYEYTHIAFDKVKLGLWWIDGHVENNFPGYRKTLVEFSEPYIELFKNLGIILSNIGASMKEVAIEKYPVIVQSIESYAPGLVEQSQNAVSNVWSSSVFYFNRSIDYLRKEVFVGQLSPENMQRVVFEALNTTQIKASEYYHWLYEKVQTTIK